MGKISIGGGVGDMNVVDGDANTVTTTKTSGDPNTMKWVMIAMIAIFVVVGLAWGTNKFAFKGMGIEGESQQTESKE